tara:strand:+ start:198 stop:365 length:168 start_codon:yes stop_codon:yes gene_type:complete
MDIRIIHNRNLPSGQIRQQHIRLIRVVISISDILNSRLAWLVRVCSVIPMFEYLV